MAWGCRLSPGVTLALFCYVNLLNYMDRGILAGGYELINSFILETLPAATSQNVDAYRGILTSSFIVSYALSTVMFGHLVHYFPPFKLMSFGLLVWCIAVLICSIAPNYPVLLIGRALSGVGEGSFQCVVPPYIDDKSTPANRARNLAYFFAMIPFGTAVGYGWSAIIGGNLGWRWSFGLEAPMMLPALLVVFFLPYDIDKGSKAHADHGHGTASKAALLASPTGVEGDGGELAPKPSLWAEIVTVFSSPIYVCAAFGYAGYTFAVAGFGAFGPQFLHDLQLVNSLGEASTVFGGLIAVTGFVGTAAGGLVLDWMQSRDDEAQKARLGVTGAGALVISAMGVEDGVLSPAAEGLEAGGLHSMEIDSRPAGGVGRFESEAVVMASSSSTTDLLALASSDAEGVFEPDGREGEAGEVDEAAATRLRMLDVKLCASLRQVTVVTLVGLLVCLAAPFCVPLGLPVFAAVLGVGTLALFAATAGTNIAIMASVPAEARPLAIGLGTVITHAFGDVPSPILIGLLSDRLAPDFADGRPRSRTGLQITLLIVVCWIAWAVLLWGAAWLMSRARRASNERNRVYEELGGDDKTEWQVCGKKPAEIAAAGSAAPLMAAA